MKGSTILWLTLVFSAWCYVSYNMLQPAQAEWAYAIFPLDWEASRALWFIVPPLMWELISYIIRDSHRVYRAPGVYICSEPPKWASYTLLCGIGLVVVHLWAGIVSITTSILSFINNWADKNIGA